MVNTMSLFDGLSRDPASRNEVDTPPPPLSPFEDLLPYSQANLARGIVWADILADIEADEQARQQMRDAA
jgi:hypothetical protein